MQQRRIPNTDLDVSVVCLGTMTFGTPVDQEGVDGIIDWCLDNGLNFIDTADMYEGYTRFLGSPGGKSEALIGNALVGRRDKAVITTKVGNPIGDDSYSGTGLGRDHVLHQIDASLERLRTDYVDIYEMHRDDPDTPLEESIATMAGLIEAGKVRHWGFSNFEPDDIHRMIALCDGNGWPRPVIAQPQLSWLVRDSEEAYNPACIEYDIAVTPYRTLQAGLLTGKYKRGQEAPPGSRGDESSWLDDPDDELWDRIEQFEREAAGASLTPTQYAVKWLLDRPGVTSVIVGCKRPDQLEPFVEAFA
ncbi:MAG: aldo/keto reductase [Dehalococcoidia bacterium]|nr:aldo/keto reductase [Dehalococcoidia bacterium]